MISLLFHILHFPFAFQIYHSPIHKQAESKSLHQFLPLQISTSQNASEFIFLSVIYRCVCFCQTCLFCHLSFFWFTFTVELNEIGFKFGRKCINYIETNGKGPDWKFMPAFFSSVSYPAGGVVEALVIFFDAPPADCSQGKNTRSTQLKLNISVCFTSEESLIITSLHTLKAQPILFKLMTL